MVGTYRAEEVSPELQDLLDDAPCTVFHVERLEESDIVHIMTQMLGQPPGDTLVQVVSAKANGNPFFVAEYLQTMVESGRLRLNALDRWTLNTTPDEHGLETLPEPQSIQSLIQTRLERLAHHTQRLTQMAAVWGRRVNRHTLETLIQMGSYRFQNTLDALIQHQIFEPDPADSAQIQFVHDTIREVAYAQLDPELRAQLHRQVAQHLEHHSEQHPNDGAPFGVLARHWSQAHEPTQARTYFVKAALHAAQRWALADAHHYFQSALALYTPDDPDTIAIRLDLVEHVLLKLGHNAQVIEQAEQALETLQHAVPSLERPEHALRHMQARAHIALGQVFALWHLKQEHQYDKALFHTERGLSLAETLGDDNLKAQALENLDQSA